MDPENKAAIINEALDVRYVKLKFTVSMANDCVLPKYKASMLRGGIGEMLLRANCIRDRDCEKCDFESECIVQRTMYSKFNNKPEFVTEGDSIGYVLECEAKKTEYCSGEQFSFFLILFGKTIVYFSQYLNAIYALGNYGIGKDNAKYQVVSVQNSYGRHIMDGNNIFMKYYQVENLREYVKRRRNEVAAGDIRLIFYSPVSIKYHGEILNEFNADALIQSLARRIYLMDCFEDKDIPRLDLRNIERPEIISQNIRHESVPRFSNRKQQKIHMNGISGEIALHGVNKDVLLLLLAGEILHVGKNSSFGFGRYIVGN